MKFLKIDTYLTKSEGFDIEVKHWTRGSSHCWCVYAVIFDTHPLFSKFRQYDFDAGDRLYPHFHNGCTFFSPQKTYIKVGCDFQHVGDELEESSAEMPESVRIQAEKLFEYLGDIK